MPTCRALHPAPVAFGFAAGLAVLAALALPRPAQAVEMVNDPKGFNGIQWGVSLEDRPNLTLVSSTARLKEFDLKDGPLPLGEAKVEMMRFSTLDGKFARVTIRYKGKSIHAQVLAYLESQYGPLDHTPGQTMRGMNQQFNWRGSDTEINMTYTGTNERGYLFIENAALSTRFNESLAGYGH